MKIKTSELTGAALDWAVQKAEGKEERWSNDGYCPCYSTDWGQGGPIIAREWDMLSKESTCVSGDELLRHYMRCYVAIKLGDEVDVPEELA